MKPSGNRIVWITGASSGIGAALARAWAAEGARCVLSARREDALEAVRRSCADPDRHVVLPLDATAFDTHGEAVRRVYGEIGPVDVLVLNSGIGQRGSALDTDLDVVRRIMEVNFTGSVSLGRLVAARMATRGSGHLVVTSSVTGRVPVPGRSTYAASKHALHGYFEALRAEVHDRGVRVTMACPGYVLTDISENALAADGSRHGVTDAQHRRGMDADVCARQILRAVRHGRAEVHPGGPETLAMPLNRLLPGLSRLLLRRYARRGAVQ